MNNLTIKNYKGISVIDSREVSQMIGKQHAHLTRDIKKYIDVISTNPKLDSLDFFIEDKYEDSKGEMRTCYLLTKKGCEMVANKMTGEKGILFTAEYVQAFNKMEQAIQAPKKLTAIEQLKLQNEAILEVDKKVDEVIEEVKDLKNNTTISYGQQEVINRTAKEVVVHVLGGKDTPAYKELNKKVFSSFWKDYKRVMQVASYRDTLIKDYDKALDFIIAWHPNRDLELMIIGCNAQLEMEAVHEN